LPFFLLILKCNGQFNHLQLAADVGIPIGLRALNVQEADLAVMAGNAQNYACMLTRARRTLLK
jgi:alcohol dehydrogenase class IV